MRVHLSWEHDVGWFLERDTPTAGYPADDPGWVEVPDHVVTAFERAERAWMDIQTEIAQYAHVEPRPADTAWFGGIPVRSATVVAETVTIPGPPPAWMRRPTGT